jgi:hypothetical protein
MGVNQSYEGVRAAQAIGKQYGFAEIRNRMQRLKPLAAGIICGDVKSKGASNI